MNLLKEIFGYPKGELTLTNSDFVKEKNSRGNAIKRFVSEFKEGRDRKFIFSLIIPDVDAVETKKIINIIRDYLKKEVSENGRLFSYIEERPVQQRGSWVYPIDIVPGTFLYAFNVQFDVLANNRWYEDSLITLIIAEQAFSQLAFIGALHK